MRRKVAGYGAFTGRVMLALGALAVNQAALAAAASTSGSPATALGAPAAAPAPDALFDRAVSVAEHEGRSPYATYTVVVRVTAGQIEAVRSWSTTEDMRHRIVLARSFADEEDAHPVTPHGINLEAHRRIVTTTHGSLDPKPDGGPGVSINSKPVNPAASPDLVGPVALAVDQDFGLTPGRSYRVAHDEATVAAGADELMLIGRTGTSHARYRVALLDTAGTTAHLALTPLADPYHRRLRELWVDTQSAEVSQAVVAGIGDRAPFDRVPWRVTFARHDGATFVAQAQALQPIALGKTSASVSITFDDLQLRESSPLRSTFGIEAPVRYLRDP